MLTVDFLNELRRGEWESVRQFLPIGSRILEIGAGTGQQALLMESCGFNVTAIDLESSNYAGHRVVDVIDYDGRTFPFDDATFDIIFSSNVLEHVPDLETLHRESKRVLKPNGVCVHIMPTHHWRFWTSIAAVPAFFQAAIAFLCNPGTSNFRRAASRGYVALRQPRHGEQGNVLTELLTFHPRSWRRHFLAHNFEVIAEREVGLFYTGESILGPKLSLDVRRKLNRWFGSACYMFKLRPIQTR